MTTQGACPLDHLETLLIVTDGTVYSEGAIREGIKFAAKCASTLYVCMTLETNPEYETIGQDAFRLMEEEAEAHLLSIKDRATQAGLRCETIFRTSADAAQVIVEEAVAKKADMIVIGRRGHKGFLKALMGEVAAQVITDAPCKVMVVPKAALIEYKHILVATDGAVHAPAAVREAVAIAKRNGSTLLALSAMRDESERQAATEFANQAAALARQEGVEALAITPLGRSFNAIVEEAGGRGVDLIVMGAYGKTGLKKLLMGSATEKVISSAGCAVLVVKAA
jgi:hypothetical protein